MPDDALAGIFMNVNGEQFLPMMQSNRSLQTLLMGINQAVDMDNIMRSVDGDMAIVLPTLGDADLKMMMAAKLAHSKWLGDVDYWKTSCPAGAKIANWGKNSYFYTDGKTSFYFGVTDDKQFFSGSDELTAQYAVKPSNHPIDARFRSLSWDRSWRWSSISPRVLMAAAQVRMMPSQLLLVCLLQSSEILLLWFIL